MKEYPKIDTVYKRDPETNFKTLLVGDYSTPAFEYLANNEWIFTEKVNGTNIRVMFSDGEIEFGGKTDNAQIPAPLVRRLEKMFHSQIEALTELFPEGGCLYGEGYGAKIQKGGGNYAPFQDFVLFDVRVGEWWLQRPDIESIAGTLGLLVVPIIGRGTLHEMVAIARTGFDSQWGKFPAEGIVAKPTVELRARNKGRIITKIKTKDFAAVREKVQVPQ